mgnify:CR=1 FL=1
MTCKTETDKSRFTLSQEAINAFYKLRDLLSSPTMLMLPDLEKPFYIFTDASTMAGAGILMQKYENKLRVVAYAFKTFDKNSRANNVALYLEGLTVVYLLTKEWSS